MKMLKILSTCHLVIGLVSCKGQNDKKNNDKINTTTGKK